MTDPFLTRDWADQHRRFTIPFAAMLRRAARTLRVSLGWLYRHDFDAPWTRDLRRGRA